MRIYLDVCSIQRPLDDPTPFRIHLEAEAVLGLLAFCESGQADLLVSVAHIFENDRNPHPFRKRFVQEVMAISAHRITTNPAVEQRARHYHEQGVKPLDALHVACAIEGRADYFCTCDDKLLRRLRLLNTEQTEAVSPLELIERMET